MDKSNLFDQKIREAVNKYEVPYDEAAWKNIEKEINSPLKPSSAFNMKPWFIAAATAAVIAIAYFAIKPDTKDSTTVLTESKIEAPKELKDETINSSKIESESIVKKDKDVEEGEESTTIISSESTEPSSNEKMDDSIESPEPLLIVDDEIEEIPVASKEKIIEPTPDIMEETLLVDVTINNERICQNELLVVSLNNANQPVEIVWDFGDGVIMESPNAMHMYTEAGSYKLTLKAKSVLNDELEQKESYTIQVKPSPQADFEVEMGENMYALPEVSFNLLSDQMESFEWKFNDGTVSNTPVVEKLFRNKGVYNIGLVVSNQFHCTDTLYKQVVIEEDFNLLAPNAFSPNGDGINDTFMPQALPYLNQNFTLQIFDPKTSQLVFESSNFEIPWNGNLMNNGNKMKEGAYAWSVRTDDGSIYKGTILITAK